MARRGHGDGTIYRDTQRGIWRAAVSLEGGKRKYVSGRTRQEAQAKLAALQREVERGLPLGDARQTVGDYFVRWLETIKPAVKPKTWRGYEQHVRLHIAPRMGGVKLVKLSPQHVQMYYATLLGEGLSSTTVKQDHAVLHHGLEDAIRLGLIARNVSELVTVPRKRQREMRVWTVEEARRFLEHVASAEPRMHPFFALAIASGMRQGELLALRWRAVDLPRRVVRVVANVSQVAGGQEYGEPKTKRSRRRISIPLGVAEALREHRLRQHRERLELGPAWVDHGLVFCREDGAPLTPGMIYPSLFLRLVRAADLPAIRFHDLRHTCATILLGRGVNPKVVSEMLGHSSVAITLDIYSHVLPDMQEAAADAVGAALFG